MMLTAKRAAELMGVSRSLVYALVAAGTLPAVRIGTGRGTIRIDQAEVEKYLAAAKIEPPVIHELKFLTTGQ